MVHYSEIKWLLLVNNWKYPSKPSGLKESSNIMAGKDRLFNPRSLYFDNLDALECWYFKKSISSNDKINIARERIIDYKSAEPLDSARKEGETPILTVCHDFKGGYQKWEDRNPLGEYKHPTGDHYWLRYTELVGEFIYFSHHTISIPTVCWSNYLHRHGTPVLGTLILENFDNGTAGAELFKRKDDGTFLFVEILTSLCKTFNFEGWLVNLETKFPVDVAHDVPSFVQALTSSINSNVPQGRVVWYDSYLQDFNRVIYQNEVNEFNETFFFKSDKFMTNYAWDLSNMEKTLKNVGILGMRNKVSVGIDIWGRSMKVGQGGMTTDIALSYVKKFDGNATLFAPAWTYENFDHEQFTRIDDEFWTRIENSIGRDKDRETMPLHVGGGAMTFLTLFSTGAGKYFNMNGSTVSSSNWVQLSMASPMPIKDETLKVDESDAYIGGTCLKFTPDMEKGSICLFRFQQYFKAKSVDDHKLQVRVHFKNSIEKLSVFLKLNCFVIRRGKKSGQTFKVKEFIVKVPLKISKNWEYAESSFNIPKLSLAFNEEFLLDDVSLCWCPDSYDGDFLTESWVMVPEQEEDGTDGGGLLLGLFSLELFNQRAKVSEQSQNLYLSPENTLRWKDDPKSFMWVVLDSDHLAGVTFTPIWPVSEKAYSNMSILQVNRNGICSQIGVTSI